MEPETDNQARPGQASLGSEQPGNAYAINKLQDKSYLPNPPSSIHPLSSTLLSLCLAKVLGKLITMQHEQFVECRRQQVDQMIQLDILDAYSIYMCYKSQHQQQQECFSLKGEVENAKESGMT